MTISLRSLALPLGSLVFHLGAAAPLESRSGCQPRSTIQWSNCTAGFPSGLECGRLSVPIDWDHPSGEHFDLGLVRLPAALSSPNSTIPKLGSLFVNPGGPGGLASTLVATLALAPTLLGPLTAAYDIIGLDPRGVGLSNAVQCDPAIYNERVSLFPETQAEFDALADHNRRLGESCLELTGPLLAHLDTASVARDHEAARIALGEGEFNLLGQSYGTQLGAQYAELFPGSVGKLALDGMVQHSQGEASNVLVGGVAYERALAAFLDWAGESPESALQGYNATEIWEGLVSAAPIPAPGCADSGACRDDVTAEELRFNAASYMVFATGAEGAIAETNWGVLSQAVAEAAWDGNATMLSSALAVEGGDPALYAHRPITCLDWETKLSSTLAGVREQSVMMAGVAPLTRGATEMWTIERQCVGWPLEVQNPPAALAGVGKEVGDKTLLIHSTGDHSTPYVWGIGMREEMPGSVLLTRKGYGHTSFALGGDAATLAATFLLTGERPAEGTIVTS